MKRRDYVGVSYGGPRSKGRSAIRLVRYVGNREGARTFGDREGFLETVKERTNRGCRSAYVHIIVSPERGEALNDRDFARFAGVFIKDREGNECRYFGAIHRDSSHPHVHIAIARDKVEKRELQGLKKEVRNLISVRELYRESPWHEGIGDAAQRGLAFEQKRPDRAQPPRLTTERMAGHRVHEQER